MRTPDADAFLLASVCVNDVEVGQKTTSNFFINSAITSDGSSPFTLPGIIST